jgi:hypothetical protein
MVMQQPEDGLILFGTVAPLWRKTNTELVLHLSGNLLSTHRKARLVKQELGFDVKHSGLTADPSPW